MAREKTEITLELWHNMFGIRFFRTDSDGVISELFRKMPMDGKDGIHYSEIAREEDRFTGFQKDSVYKLFSDGQIRVSM